MGSAESDGPAFDGHRKSWKSLAAAIHDSTYATRCSGVTASLASGMMGLLTDDLKGASAMRKPIKREWRHMEADEKIELLRADSIRLFALGNDRDAKIEELKRRIERIERFLSTLGER